MSDYELGFAILYFLTVMTGLITLSSPDFIPYWGRVLVGVLVNAGLFFMYWLAITMWHWL